MRSILASAFCAALLLAQPAQAQQTYPTVRAPDRVSGTVPLQCDSSGQACGPITAANPMQVAATVGGVAQGSTTSGQTGVLVQCATTTSAPTYVTAKTNPLSCDTSGGLRVSGSAVAQGSTTSGQTGTLSQGAVTTAAPSYTTAQTSPLSLDTAGNLRTSATLGAGSAVIGKVGIDQTTPGTTNLVALAANQSVNVAQINGVTALMGNGVTGTGSQRVTIASDNTAFSVNTIAGQTGIAGGSGSISALTVRTTPAGMEYETIAASQTNQVMGATGATGDYLSHCILQPTTTAAGTFTILDNATTLFTYTTGTLSDLRPIVIPVGLTSVSGAWKITTGANETAICIGDFL